MAHFVQHLSDEGVVHSIITELSTSYTSSLRQKDTDPVKETKVYPEVSEWYSKCGKFFVDKDSYGIFQLCYNVRNNLLNPGSVEGSV